MPATLDDTSTGPKQVLMVIANLSVSTTLGWPVGFWGSELTHPYHAFAEAGYQVTVASPEGGRCELDAYSDPRDESGYSAEDLITMGFLNRPSLVALLEDTPKLADLDLDRFDAIVVCGGQSPMFTFRDNADLQAAIRTFYETEKPTAALCHGVSALIDLQLSDDSYLIEGKTMTGFANARRTSRIRSWASR
jgi:putative intracellular protease/amidase